MSDMDNAVTATADAAVDLTAYDVILVNSSAGKDSQAMLHVIATQAKAAGVLDRVHVVHATFDEEWAGTEALARQQAAAYGLPCYVVRHPKGSLLEAVRARGMWPDARSRYCTSDFKRGQVSKQITSLVASHPAFRLRPVTVLNCMGIRAAESRARAKKVWFAVDERNTNSRRVVTTYYPIFKLTVDQVWATIREAGTPVHDAYKAGMPRLSCVFCVFAPKAALMRAGQLNPELLAKYVQVEKEIGHRFTQALAISDVQDALARGEQPGTIKTWEM